MDMEKRMIGHTMGYLIAKDAFLLMLVCGHILVYYHLLWQLERVIVALLFVGALLWILFFTNLLRTVSMAKKDDYIVTAFKDEYFSNIRVKAGSNGYGMMILFCSIAIVGSVILDALSIQIDIPLYITCEMLLLLGVVTDDVSKIVLSKG